MAIHPSKVHIGLVVTVDGLPGTWRVGTAVPGGRKIFAHDALSRALTSLTRDRIVVTTDRLTERPDHGNHAGNRRRPHHRAEGLW